AFQRALAATLARRGADAVLTPTWPFAAPPIHAETVTVHGRPVPVDPHRNCFVRAANAARGCAVTLPVGLYPEAGVPAGLQLLAPEGADDALLSLAALVEAALPRLPRPPAAT
ncbi:MAG: amidase family protein, partial [Candidatus Rokuibacteriota bacterium]